MNHLAHSSSGQLQRISLEWSLGSVMAPSSYSCVLCVLCSGLISVGETVVGKDKEGFRVEGSIKWRPPVPDRMWEQDWRRAPAMIQHFC